MFHFPGAFTYVVLKLWSASNTKKDNHAEKSAPIVLDYIHLLAKCWAVKFGDMPLLRQHIKEDLKFSADHQTELSHWYFYIGYEKNTPFPWNKSAKPCMCRNSTPKREGCDVFVPAYLFNLLTEDQGFCSSAALLLLKFVLPTRPVGWSVRALSDTSKPSPACYMSAVSEELQSLPFPWQLFLSMPDRWRSPTAEHYFCRFALPGQWWMKESKAHPDPNPQAYLRFFGTTTKANLLWD